MRARSAGPRIALVSLGCDKNTVDSERMMAALVGNGASVTRDAEGADMVIVNTCGFIQEATEESIETMLGACEMKAGGGPRAVVAVGCLVERYKNELVEEIPEVDLFMGLSEVERLVPELRSRGLLPDEDAVSRLKEWPPRILLSETSHTSYLKISEGCDQACAFCSIPLMRGRHRSDSVEALVREAASLEAQGVREINIVSQDTTWYGRDLVEPDPDAPRLTDLMRALLDGTDVPWYRLFTMYPSGITREIVDLIAWEARILPYVDMPIEHGSDRVLELMRRPERQAMIRERVSWLRDAVADLTLRTTVMVGFPGETEEDFANMLRFLDEIRFDRVGVFTYSVEEGTAAADMDGHIPAGEARERRERLMELQRNISFEKNLALVGTRTSALVDRIVTDDPDFPAVARTKAQALDVDGVTLLRPAPGLAPGQILEVDIVDALDYDLFAEVMP